MLKNAALNTGSSFLYFFLQWLTTVLAVRFADFETAGIFALAISFTNIFYFIALFGIRNFQISDVEGRFSEGQYTAARLAAILAASLAFGITVPWLGLSPYTLGCYVLYMIFKLCEVYSDGFFARLQAEDRYERLAVSYSVKGLLSTGMFAAVLYVTHDLLLSIAAMAGSYFVAFLLTDLPCLQNHFVHPTWEGCTNILRSCIPLLVISASVPTMNYVTRYAIEQEFSSYYVGQYASLSSVIVVLSTLGGAVFAVVVPEVSRLVSSREARKIEGMFLRILILILLMGVAAILAGIFLGPPVCRAIFGAEILESIDLLVPLLATSTALVVKSFFSAMLVPLKRRTQLMLGECCGCILCVLTALPFTRLWGMYGANFSYFIGVLLQSVILASCAVHALRRLKCAG